MSQKFRLMIELVPSTVWFSSVYQLCRERNQLGKWKEIKKEIFDKEGKRCWICGDKNARLEAHEFWKYDEEDYVQKLVAIHHLCNMCHKIKHIGFWCYTEDGRQKLVKEGLNREDLIDHFCRVNCCSREEFDKHEKESFELWEKRSKHEWKQDFGIYQIM